MSLDVKLQSSVLWSTWFSASVMNSTTTTGALPAAACCSPPLVCAVVGWGELTDRAWSLPIVQCVGGDEGISASGDDRVPAAGEKGLPLHDRGKLAGARSIWSDKVGRDRDGTNPLSHPLAEGSSPAREGDRSDYVVSASSEDRPRLTNTGFGGFEGSGAEFEVAVIGVERRVNEKAGNAPTKGAGLREFGAMSSSRSTQPGGSGVMAPEIFEVGFPRSIRSNSAPAAERSEMGRWTATESFLVDERDRAFPSSVFRFGTAGSPSAPWIPFPIPHPPSHLIPALGSSPSSGPNFHFVALHHSVLSLELLQNSSQRVFFYVAMHSPISDLPENSGPSAAPERFGLSHRHVPQCQPLTCTPDNVHVGCGLVVQPPAVWVTLRVYFPLPILDGWMLWSLIPFLLWSSLILSSLRCHSDVSSAPPPWFPMLPVVPVDLTV
ncbi:hypothetical protein DFH06DRAFT_1153413 [Mycena polygramma]|nr:hypothetical protein DFH06DRAFT_1153413 [Mycena polygramma]